MQRFMFLLLPLAWLYGLVVRLRNLFFDRGWLRSRTFPLPVICVGNLAVGGTGKTPHTEYVTELLLSLGRRVAVLSRGYGRRTKGYVEVEPDMDARDTGDEPLQMKRKQPQMTVVVCEDRCQGLDTLLRSHPDTEVVVLDDAFQHRYVRAGLNILLTDSARPFSDDFLLPAGRLREPASGAQRAQVIVVTKVQEGRADLERLRRRIAPRPGQSLFFSTFGYGPLYPLFASGTPAAGTAAPDVREAEVLVVTGIARPAPLWQQVEAQGARVHRLAFPDHHAFTAADAVRINRAFAALPAGRRRLAVTTEKDAARLRHLAGLSDELRAAFYVQPVAVRFLPDLKETDFFNQIIKDYVSKDSRNSTMD